MFGKLSDLPYDDECRSKQFAVSLKKWPIQLHYARSFQIPLCQTSLLYPATDSPFVFQHSRTLVLLKHTVLLRYYQQSTISVLQLCVPSHPLLPQLLGFSILLTKRVCITNYMHEIQSLSTATTKYISDQLQEFLADMVIILVDLIIALKVKLGIPFEITPLIASVLPVPA